MTVIKQRALMLRTCNADMTSHKGFVWPESGPIEAPDWSETAECGGGLHGFLWGEGDGDLARWSQGTKWLVVEVYEYVDLGGKIKSPRGIVVYLGDRRGATDYIIANGARGAVIGVCVSAGHYGTAMAGSNGTATAGYNGTATAGDYGTATAGYKGTATAGYKGTATAGYKGTAMAGGMGTIVIKWHDGDRYRLAVGYVGDDGIKANTKYRVEGGKFVEVPE